MRGRPCHGWSGQDPRKGSNLGDWKQSVDLRHFQAGPGGGDWGQLGDKVPAPCLPTARGALLTCMGAADATAPYSPSGRKARMIKKLSGAGLLRPSIALNIFLLERGFGTTTGGAKGSILVLGGCPI